MRSLTQSLHKKRFFFVLFGPTHTQPAKADCVGVRTSHFGASPHTRAAENAANNLPISPQQAVPVRDRGCRHEEEAQGEHERCGESRKPQGRTADGGAQSLGFKVLPRADVGGRLGVYSVVSLAAVKA